MDVRNKSNLLRDAMHAPGLPGGLGTSSLHCGSIRSVIYTKRWGATVVPSYYAGEGPVCVSVCASRPVSCNAALNCNGLFGTAHGARGYVRIIRWRTTYARQIREIGHSAPQAIASAIGKQYKIGGVARVLLSRGPCSLFWPTVPPLQVVPSFACSVSSLSRYPGR